MNSVVPTSLIDMALLAADSEPSTDGMGERVLDAAFEQFRLLGIRRSSMEDIARRAGVGRVTIYRRFESKDRLVQALLLRECRHGIAAVDEAAARVDGLEAKIAESFTTATQAIRSHPLILGLLRTEPETILPLLSVRANVGVTIGRTYAARMIRVARRELGLPDDDAEHVGEVFTRLVLSLVLTPKTCIPIDDPDATREFARRVIVPMVTRPTPA